MSATRCRLIAMRDAGVAISCVHIDKKYIVFEGGLRLKIRLFNDEGEQVSNPEDATWYEFGSDTLGYGTASFHLDEFTEWNH